MVVADDEVAGGRRAVVFDFGIAKLAAAQKHPATQGDETDLRIALGTATYIAPEQATGEGPPTAAVDVYALGVMLYELACGAPPFAAGSPDRLLELHSYSDPLPLHKLVPDLPPPLPALVGRMLAKAAAERPRMADVVGELDRLLAGIAPSGRSSADGSPSGQLPAPTLGEAGAAGTAHKGTDQIVQPVEPGASPALQRRESASPAARRKRNTEPLPQHRDSTTLPLAKLLAGEETLPPLPLRDGGRATANLASSAAALLQESETIPLARTDEDPSSDAATELGDETRPPLRPSPRPPWAAWPARWLVAAALFLFLAGFLLRACIAAR